MSYKQKRTVGYGYSWQYAPLFSRLRLPLMVDSKMSEKILDTRTNKIYDSVDDWLNDKEVKKHYDVVRIKKELERFGI